MSGRPVAFRELPPIVLPEAGNSTRRAANTPFEGKP
jgi:hypothetical protein